LIAFDIDERKNALYFSPDGNGNPVIANELFQKITSFVVMTDCNGQPEPILAQI
jgi:hypothetical protein